MASIIDQIFQGVIPYTDNEALQSLGKIFGEQLLGVGATSSRLVTLSTALNPIYLGLLFIILAYIGVSGVVRTATDGKFLGRNWSSFGVPAMFMACVVLLTPVPTQNGATLGQVVFVKALKFGSNFADFTLMKVFDQAQSEAITYNLASEHIPQVNDQMKGAFVMYMCANQITQMGYGSKINYFLLLKNVCGLPADMVGLFSKFYILGNAGHVSNIQRDLDSIASATGLRFPAQVRYDPSAVERYTQNMTPISKQLNCHFTYFDTYFRNAVPAALATNAKITPLYPVPKIAIPNNPNPTADGVPVQVSNTLLAYNKPHLSAMWPEALNASYRCLLNPAILQAQAQLKDTYTTAAGSKVPWRAGWSNAALAISDELDTYKKAMNGSKLPLSMEVVATPKPSQLGDSLSDKKNQALLAASLNDIQEFTSGINNSPDQASQVLTSALAAISSVPGTPLDWTRIGATVILPVALANTNAMGNAGPQTIAQAAKLEKAKGFLNSLVGRASTITSAGLGKMSSLVAALFTKVSTALDFWQKKDKLVESVGGGGLLNPVGMAAKVVNGIANVLMPGPTTMMALSVLLLVVNVVVLLPQVVLLVVMLIWMAKAAVWYMIIPLATVLIALPNTRVGHDIWKSALAIILTPFLALLFYIVSLYIFDQMYASVIYWVFQPILEADGAWKTTVSILMQIFTGEIIFRFLAGVSLVVAVTVYMSMMILRGPDLITQSLGLRGSSGDLGDEFNSLRHRLDPAGKAGGLLKGGG